MESSAYAIPAHTADRALQAPGDRADARPLVNRPAEPAGLPARTGALLQAVLDHLQFGLVVVDPALQVQFANQAALHACAHDLPLGLDGGRLTVHASRQRDGLQRALAGARSGRWSLVMLSQGEQLLPLVVLPIWQAPGAEPSVLLIFGVRGPQRCLALQFFAQSCGLTAAEARVLRELAEGHSPRAISQQHGVELSTVRTQIGSARAKTETHSITELVRVIGALPPVMPAALSRVQHRPRDARDDTPVL